MSDINASRILLKISITTWAIGHLRNLVDTCQHVNNKLCILKMISLACQRTVTVQRNQIKEYKN